LKNKGGETMKKVALLMLALMVACAPVSFANVNAVCDAVDSEDYLKASGGRLIRGIGNVALSWTEIFRQPAMADNKWEGLGRGILHTIGRALSGAVRAATFFIPTLDVPQLDPTCPTDLVTGS
jgi:hypothetical protein